MQLQIPEIELSPKSLGKFENYPRMRYMGGKQKLLPWIQDTLKGYEFETVLDGFSGSGAVSYLFKTMNKTVYSNDFLKFSSLITKATIENNNEILNEEDLLTLFDTSKKYDNFIKLKFKNVFFSEKDLDFLDRISENIKSLKSENKKALAYTALFRSCLKKQPRGVFTISGNLEKYNDGRRDLIIDISEHFIEQVNVYNEAIFDNKKQNLSFNQDIFLFNESQFEIDLVYLDPPYVPKSDDNCYIKRYHFLEGLSNYWIGEKILESTKVKKIEKKYTPFSYKKTAIEAFDKIFKKFSSSIIVLSYSSNAYPELDDLIKLLSKYKNEVKVFEKPYNYHFGNHSGAKRKSVNEYLIIGK